MMYTPTPTARRPRPPSSLHRQRQRAPLLSSSTPGPEIPEGIDDGKFQCRALGPKTISGVDARSQRRDGLPSQRSRASQAETSNRLARISASPADVSFALDDADEGISFSDVAMGRNDSAGPRQSNSATIRAPVPIGLGLSASNSGQITGDLAEISPPPPYGHAQMHASAASTSSGHDFRRPGMAVDGIGLVPSRTPPRQDSGVPSRQASTSPADPRQSHASARTRTTTSILRNPVMPASASRTVSQHARMTDDEPGSEEDLDDAEAKAMLRDMKRQLKQRDDEIILASLIAEEAIRSQEQLATILPQQLKNRIAAQLANYNPSGNAQSPGQILMRSPSMEGSSPHPLHVRHLSSMLGNHPLSPIEDYPPSASTNQDSRSRMTSIEFQDAALDSPFRVLTPEQTIREHNPLRAMRLSGDGFPSFAMNRHRSRPSVLGTRSLGNARVTSPRYARLAALQVEAEDRIAALEQALTEARESEDSQRKVASRLRRDVDKLQRDLIRAEERAVEEETTDLRSSVSGPMGQRRRRSPAVDEVDQVHAEEDERLAWVSNNFPEFPSAGLLESGSHNGLAGSSQGESQANRRGVSVHLAAVSSEDANDADDSDSSIDGRNLPTQLSAHTIPVDEVGSLTSTSMYGELTSSRHRRKEPSSRRTSGNTSSIQSSGSGDKVVSVTSVMSQKLSARRLPKSPAPPSKVDPEEVTSRSQLHSAISRVSADPPAVHASSPVTTEPSTRRLSASSAKRSVNDLSPDVRRTLDFFSSGSQGSEYTRSPSMSPALASLTSRMASIRAYVSHNISIGPSGAGMARTLGSELGSDLEVDWDKQREPGRALHGIHWRQGSIDHVAEALVSSPSPPPRSSHSPLIRPDRQSGDDTDSDEEGDNDDTFLFSPASQPLLPLPPNVSAALSSLAMALAPTNLFGKLDTTGPILLRGSLRDADLDYATYELLNEAVKSRTIKWAEDDTSSEASRGAEADKQPRERGAALTEGIRSWMTNRDPWNGNEYPEDSDWSESHDTQKAPTVSRPVASRPAILTRPGQRPVSYLGPVTQDTPRRIALAHRRVNSAACVTRKAFDASSSSSPNEDDFGPSFPLPRPIHDAKGKGKLVPMRPDQTLTRSGIRSVRPLLDPASLGHPARSDHHMLNVKMQTRSKRSEPSTIPAKLVHDVFCLIAILLEYVEWSVILVVRICVDIRNGPRGIAGVRMKQREKRYYI
ncbi:hypothetical protein IAU60_003003 [Kwoniella sp. DSM 27419]